MWSEHAVLAVGGEPGGRLAIHNALAGDCRVLAAESAAEALALMARSPVGLAIVDHRRPDPGGIAFLAEAAARYPAVVRVALADHPRGDRPGEAIEEGCVYHVLAKPWDQRELRQVVRRGLECFAAALDRARLLEQLRDAVTRARREAEQRRRLVALSAHELGVPLHVLLNSLALLRTAEIPAGAAHWIAAADRAGEWLARSVARLSDANRLCDRRFPLRPRIVDVIPLLRAAMVDVGAAAGERALDYGVEPSPPVVVRADPYWLGRALGELLSNAVRFTPDGGRIRASVRPDDGWGVVAVADTGIGVAPEHLAEIFEPFSAASGDLLRHGSGHLAFGARGLGLGLAMVKAIADAHGGTVGAVSTPGCGSCFTLRLPCAAGGSGQ